MSLQSTREPAPEAPEPIEEVPMHAGALASMLIGIVGLFLPVVVPSLIAILLGRRAQRQLAAAHGSQSGARQATAGIVTGVIGLALTALLLLVYLGAIRPSLRVGEATFQQQTELNNVRTLAGASLRYAMEHRGDLPARLGDLAREKYVPAGMAYVTPGRTTRAPYDAADIDAGMTHYTLHLGGVPVEELAEPGRTVMLSAEALPGIVTVAFADGSTAQIEAESLTAAAAAKGWLLDVVAP